MNLGIELETRFAIVEGKESTDSCVAKKDLDEQLEKQSRKNISV